MIRGDGFIPPHRELAANVPCCGVLAVALFCRVSYEHAWHCIRAMKKRKQSWNGWTYDSERQKAVEQFGVAYNKVTLVNRMTVQQFAKWYARPGKQYMLCVRGHVMHLVDGVIADQMETKPFGEHRGRRTILLHYLERLE